jgi:carbamate kinase
MGPKIEAGIEFVERGGEECIVTNAERAADAVAGRAGTRIIASWAEGSLPLAEAGP